MSFDPSDSAAVYHDPSLRGGQTSDLGYHWSSGSSWHGSKHDGKAKTLQHIQSQLDDTALRDKAEAWGRIRDHAQTVHSRLQTAYTDAFSQWEGDDADRAAKTFGFAVASAKSVHDAADGMQQGTSVLASMATSVKGLDSSAPSGWGALGNTLLDTTTPGVVAKATGVANDTDGGGANLDPAVTSMSTAISQATTTMPNQVTWQVKTDSATRANEAGNVTPPSTKGVGGVSAPGAGGGAGHESAPVSGIGKVKQLHTGTTKGNGRGDPPPIDRTDPWVPPTDGDGGSGVGGGDGSGFGSGSDAPFSSGTGGTAGTPGLDEGSSLAGYDPSGVGGGGAGGGGLGAGGGLGSGAGGLGSAGGLSSGAGGLGSGAGGLAGAGLGGGAEGAAAAGLAGAAAGQGGRPGAVGAQPMRGGGSGGGDESERERSTWLNEDDDVWGGSEAPPSVIS